MYYFIVNQTSGNGKGRSVWAKLEQILEQKCIRYKVFNTGGPGHAFRLVESLPYGEIEAIVAVGGDGTIHEVANAMVLRSVPLGIIPAGSGNDFARSMKIPLDVNEALKTILNGTNQKMDIGKVGNEYYITIAGIGFDGLVAKVTNQSKAKRWLNRLNLGGLSYVFSVFKVLFTYKPTTVLIEVDGVAEAFDDVWLVSVANQPYYGGGIKICPEASADDGQLDVCIVHGIGKLELLLVFPMAFSGNHIHHRNVTMLKGREITVVPSDELVVQCDGEIITNPSLKFSAVRDGLLLKK